MGIQKGWAMKFVIAILMLPLLVFAKDMPKEKPELASVSFASPKDGETVKSPVQVKMDVKGLKVRVAGEAPDEKTTGHHHVIVDGAFIPEGQVIATDAKHLHFGKGQTETTITLPPGEHTLTLQFADGAHRSYGEALSKTIHIKVR